MPNQGNYLFPAFNFGQPQGLLVSLPSNAPMDWVRNVRAVVKGSDQDFHHVKPWIYWRDMIVGGAIAYTAAGIFGQLRTNYFARFRIGLSHEEAGYFKILSGIPIFSSHDEPHKLIFNYR